MMTKGFFIITQQLISNPFENPNWITDKSQLILKRSWNSGSHGRGLLLMMTKGFLILPPHWVLIPVENPNWMENQFKTDPEAILNFRITWGLGADYSDETRMRTNHSAAIQFQLLANMNQIKSKQKNRSWNSGSPWLTSAMVASSGLWAWVRAWRSGATRLRMCFSPTTALILCSMKDKSGSFGTKTHWFTVRSTSTNRDRISCNQYQTKRSVTVNAILNRLSDHISKKILFFKNWNPELNPGIQSLQLNLLGAKCPDPERIFEYFWHLPGKSLEILNVFLHFNPIPNYNQSNPEVYQKKILQNMSSSSKFHF